MGFRGLGLSHQIIKGIQSYDEPTDIQRELIPSILTGRDILAGAKTGTGKSAGFILPILEMMSRKNKKSHYIDALILVPTKELARQVAEFIATYSSALAFRSIALYGGKPISAQAKRLSQGVDIVVATTGRLVEHIRANNIDLSGVNYFVLDEADTILDMGFRREIEEILKVLKVSRQNILISATLSPSLKVLSHQMLNRPISIEISKMGDITPNIKQVLYQVKEEEKIELLSYLIGSRNYKQVLLFVRKKALASTITKELNDRGLKSATIHGDRSVGARARALSEFKEGKVQVLVATDIACRGLDIKGLDVVINYDIPHVIQDYIHRVGRTGRAKREGLAILLSSPQEIVALRDIEKMLGKKIREAFIEGFTPPKIEEKRGIRNSAKKPKQTAGAFGNRKKRKESTTKKRKTTKRDRR
ncbi:ATP-dependent RNA helicase RhlE [hydrothermal vent metagenome]|uniref:ATP-dependent RNA helicase RhlE n=1 Tax=hydrothermal vent metagenome TaxID=652676 RepID=A0A1W1EKQ7_9ZZZZ